MSASQAVQRREALQALFSGGGITPCGEGKVQRHGGSRYILLPSDVAEGKDVEQGDEMVLGYHAESGTYLAVDKDDIGEGHWAEEFK